MRFLLLTSFIAVFAAVNAAPKTVTVKTKGIYKGKDASGKPICDPGSIVCVYKTYIYDDLNVFPLGISSATFHDPDNGNDVAISSVVQTYLPDGSYTLAFTYGTSWVGPFSINSADWSF